MKANHVISCDIENLPQKIIFHVVDAIADPLDAGPLLVWDDRFLDPINDSVSGQKEE